MANEDITLAPNATGPDQIDVNNDAALADWSKKLDTTEQQLKDAIAKVGDRATDIEMYLKGSRSTTNDDRVEEAE